ncbi:hypothetical protein [Vagococcus vulneris]|uniref:hypothetical protein n=1 Tax=Vagococcus vulneris TaxID=1977869 RepID=UPI0014025338|nr:hypothetical protein [Vagococcus vulneris]
MTRVHEEELESERSYPRPGNKCFSTIIEEYALSEYQTMGENILRYSTNQEIDEEYVADRMFNGWKDS